MHCILISKDPVWRTWYWRKVHVIEIKSIDSVNMQFTLQKENILAWGQEKERWKEERRPLLVCPVTWNLPGHAVCKLPNIFSPRNIDAGCRLMKSAWPVLFVCLPPPPPVHCARESLNHLPVRWNQRVRTRWPCVCPLAQVQLLR